ncbi:MAG TPA: hypothetical protein VE983_02870 [Solirubrobacteraceae bacterium]|nr:hypothetical protein [Solirubrobacteraceae bacterium]
MGRRSLGVALAAGTVLALGQGTAIGSPGDVQCTGAFSGTARDLIVPANTQCIVDGATITHDLIVEQNGALAVENTTIGHDLTAHQAQNIETGFGGGNPGPVTVGHDVRIQGSDAPSGIAYDVCDTSIKHDLQISQTNVQFEIEVGDKGTQLDEFCALSASPPDQIGHDLVVSGNTAGRFDIGDNTVGHDLVVQNNTATTDIDVSDNTVGHDAVCGSNTPPVSKDGPEDGPNHAGHSNSCG